MSGEVDIEDLIPEETCVFTLTHEGYIKRTTLDTYQAQNRGGRGVQGMTQKDEDFTEEMYVGSTHDYMLFLTNQGRVYRLKGYQVPEGSRTAKGSHIVNLLQLQEGEKVTLMLQQKADVDEDNTYATMITKQGLIKRTPLSQFRNIRKAGLIAIALNEGDSLVWSHLTKGDDEIIVATHDGAAAAPARRCLPSARKARGAAAASTITASRSAAAWASATTPTATWRASRSWTTPMI